MTGFKQTEIGILPEDWEIKRIGDFCDIRSSSILFSEINKIKENSGFLKVLALKVSDMNLEGNENEIKTAQIEFYLNENSSYIKNLIPPFALIFPKRGAAISTNKKRITQCYSILDPNLMALIPNQTCNLYYLYHYFQRFDLRTITDKGLVSQLNKKDLLPLVVPLPSLSEQGNIAKILSVIQSAIETQEKIIQTTTELKKALMQKLFTEGLDGEQQKKDNNLKWDKVKLGILAEKGIVEFQNGFPCGQWNESGIGTPQLRPFNITDFGKIDLTQIKYIETDKSVEKYKLKQNDIIFNNTNSEELVGKTALWQNGDGYVLSNHMTIIRIKDDKSINPIYLANFLHKKWFDGHYKMVCRRHVNQASVSIERLRDIDLPYPPIDVQNEIAKSFNSIDKKIEFANAKYKTLQTLFKSMLHHLMTGQIRVKDLRFS